MDKTTKSDTSAVAFGSAESSTHTKPVALERLPIGHPEEDGWSWAIYQNSQGYYALRELNVDDLSPEARKLYDELMDQDEENAPVGPDDDCVSPCFANREMLLEWLGLRDHLDALVWDRTSGMRGPSELYGKAFRGLHERMEALEAHSVPNSITL